MIACKHGRVRHGVYQLVALAQVMAAASCPRVSVSFLFSTPLAPQIMITLVSSGIDCLLDPGIYPYLVYFKINYETKEAFLRGTTLELRENNYCDGKLVHQLLLVIYAMALF